MKKSESRVRMNPESGGGVGTAESFFKQTVQGPFLCKFSCWLRGSAGGGLATREFMQSCEINSLYKIL